MKSDRRVCTKCGKNRAARFYRTPRSRVCVTCQRSRAGRNSRSTRLWETYGITLDEYDALLASQGGVCAICKGTRNYNLDVDHDHALERALLDQDVPAREAARRSVRGLLCKNCNRRVLRSVRDDASLLTRAARYLEEASTHAQGVLG